jgi:hypothetical protein
MHSDKTQESYIFLYRRIMPLLKLNGKVERLFLVSFVMSRTAAWEKPISQKLGLAERQLSGNLTDIMGRVPKSALQDRMAVANSKPPLAVEIRIFLVERRVHRDCEVPVCDLPDRDRT